MNDDLVSLLLALDGVRQSPRYHPEGDALFHSLQVFELATRVTEDRVMWAAALFHDVGKAIEATRQGSSIDGATHDEVGADLLEGLLPPRAIWLVRHHLDLLTEPRGTRRRYHGTAALRSLELLRRWDLGGRDPRARVMSVDDALALLFAGDDDALAVKGDEGNYDPHAP
jgi:putative nucleotidyltransferase with HDIG domain